MADNPHYDLEVLGTCMTNTTEESQHDVDVESRYLWSYAQEEALVALSERGGDGCYRLIKCPERRAKRIAARYADLYFTSHEKSGNNIQFYWVALASFVVKDLVEAFRFARENVLTKGWRGGLVATAGSLAITKESPYAHAARTYAALAKGNLWLFMDIYPWLWFFQEYGISNDHTINEERMKTCVEERSWSTFQAQSKNAVEELPFGRNWLGRQKESCDTDPIFREATTYFTAPPIWNSGALGNDSLSQAEQLAHRHVRRELPATDQGYLLPVGTHWGQFKEAYYVLDESRREWKRLQDDREATSRLEDIRNFAPTKQIRMAYQTLISQWALSKAGKRTKQKEELLLIAEHEQLNVLHPLIYMDPMLKKTMDSSHHMSRVSRSYITPPFQVVYSAQATTDNPKLKTVFDAPESVIDQFKKPEKSLPNKRDRMEFVGKIADDFNELMASDKYFPGIVTALQTIRGWKDA